MRSPSPSAPARRSSPPRTSSRSPRSSSSTRSRTPRRSSTASRSSWTRSRRRTSPPRASGAAGPPGSGARGGAFDQPPDELVEGDPRGVGRLRQQARLRQPRDDVGLQNVQAAVGVVHQTKKKKKKK